MDEEVREILSMLTYLCERKIPIIVDREIHTEMLKHIEFHPELRLLKRISVEEIKQNSHYENPLTSTVGNGDYVLAW